MKPEFCTILNALKSPQNVGLIIRSHVAYGGSDFIFTGIDRPWQFKKGTQSFSRKLEKECSPIHIPSPYNALEWCKKNGYTSIAVEINQDAVFLDDFSFPDRSAIIVGNEESGLDAAFVDKCDYVVTIRQSGAVGSLNVAVAASTVMYEFNRFSKNVGRIVGSQFQAGSV